MGDAVTHLGLVKPPVGVDHQDVACLEHNLKAENNILCWSAASRQAPPCLRFFCNPTNILEEGAVSTTYDLLSNPQNVARGTTDPEIDWTKFNDHKAWWADGATCISYKFDHQMSRLALVSNLATRWHHLN